MRNLSLLLSIFLLISLIPPVMASPSYTPIFFWPMNENGGNFSMIPVEAPHCYPIYFGLPPVEIDNGTYALISGTAYTDCSNVSGPVVEILNVSSFNFTVNGMNRNFRSVKVAYYTTKSYRIALDLETTNMTITYKPYNSTYELVLVDLSNISLGPKSSDLLKTSDPGTVGWPRGFHLKFLVNKVTGEGYLLENGRRKYLGLFPLLPAPYLSPERYVEGILKRTREFISTVEANPWIVEEILNKAKVETNPAKVGEYFQGFAMNATTSILNPRYSYLGNPAMVGFNYLKDSSNNTTFALDFTSWVKRPYNVVTLTGGPMIVNRSEAKEALREYLENRNPSPLKELILKNALTIATDPYLLYELNDGFGVVDFYIPPTARGILMLPLPPGFNGSYILIKPFINGSEPFLHVNYDPTLYVPENVTGRWKALGQCLPDLRSEIASKLINILNNASTVKTFNASSFEVLYPFVEKKLRECGFNVTEEDYQPVTSSANLAGSAPGPSNEKTNTELKEKGRGLRICGPAFLVPLALIPAWLWRKRK